MNYDFKAVEQLLKAMETPIIDDKMRVIEEMIMAEVASNCNIAKIELYEHEYMKLKDLYLAQLN